MGEAASAAKRAVTTPFSSKQLQPEFQQGIRDVIGGVAKDTETAAPTAKSIRGVVEQAADNVYAKSKAQYQILDEATNGRVQRFTDRLQNIRDQLNSLTGTEEDVQKEASLLKAQKETEDAMQDAFNDAKTKGVDPTLVDQASANFKKSQALYDLDSNLKKATTGMRPNVGGGQQAAKNPETVDPNQVIQSH